MPNNLLHINADKPPASVRVEAASNNPLHPLRKAAMPNSLLHINAAKPPAAARTNRP